MDALMKNYRVSCLFLITQKYHLTFWVGWAALY